MDLKIIENLSVLTWPKHTIENFSRHDKTFAVYIFDLVHGFDKFTFSVENVN